MQGPAWRQQATADIFALLAALRALPQGGTPGRAAALSPLSSLVADNAPFALPTQHQADEQSRTEPPLEAGQPQQPSGQHRQPHSPHAPQQQQQQQAGDAQQQQQRPSETQPAPSTAARSGAVGDAEHPQQPRQQQQQQGGSEQPQLSSEFPPQTSSGAADAVSADAATQQSPQQQQQARGQQQTHLVDGCHDSASVRQPPASDSQHSSEQQQQQQPSHERQGAKPIDEASSRAAPSSAPQEAASGQDTDRHVSNHISYSDDPLRGVLSASLPHATFSCTPSVEQPGEDGGGGSSATIESNNAARQQSTAAAAAAEESQPADSTREAAHAAHPLGEAASAADLVNEAVDAADSSPHSQQGVHVGEHIEGSERLIEDGLPMVPPHAAAGPEEGGGAPPSPQQSPSGSASAAPDGNADEDGSSTAPAQPLDGGAILERFERSGIGNPAQESPTPEDTAAAGIALQGGQDGSEGGLVAIDLDSEPAAAAAAEHVREELSPQPQLLQPLDGGEGGLVAIDLDSKPAAAAAAEHVREELSPQLQLLPPLDVPPLQGGAATSSSSQQPLPPDASVLQGGSGLSASSQQQLDLSDSTLPWDATSPYAAATEVLQGGYIMQPDEGGTNEGTPRCETATDALDTASDEGASSHPPCASAPCDSSQSVVTAAAAPRSDTRPTVSEPLGVNSPSGTSDSPAGSSDAEKADVETDI